jgi:1-acyl-sn-glycerol-3-phosphate acyltransferase
MIVTRLVAFLAVYLGCEAIGLVAAFGLWLRERLRPGGEGWAGERSLAAHRRLQAWWAGTLFAAARRILAFEVRVTGSEAIAPGPALVFMRHASIVDTLIPAHALAGPAGLRLRYVLKHELLWDPCLDVVGHRLPNVFVARNASDSAAEIARVAELARGLGARDGVLIYPEGTRFTPAKRARILARLSTDRPELYARARSLAHVLPPKLGGATVLLDAAPDADVLFVAHVGFEGLTGVSRLLDGSLVGRRVEVGVWRVRRDAIPEEPDKRVAWLFDEWARLDAWIAERVVGADA